MIRYAVTSGHPDTGKKCTVTASEGGDIIAYYIGWLDVRRGLWKLYMDLNPGRRRLASTLILKERDVHYEVGPAIMERKKNTKKTAGPKTEPTGVQLKLG